MIGYRLINSVQLFAALRIHGNGNRDILTIAAGAAAESVCAGIRCMFTHNIPDDDFQIVNREPHGFDGKNAGKF